MVCAKTKGSDQTGCESGKKVEVKMAELLPRMSMLPIHLTLKCFHIRLPSQGKSLFV